MKKNVLILFGTVLVLLSSCSNPYKQGCSLAEEYGSVLSEASRETQINEFINLEITADSVIASKLGKFVEKYKDEELVEFKRGFDSVKYVKQQVFNAVYENAIRDFMKDCYFYKPEKGQADMYLYSFARDTFSSINYKGGIAYILKKDTMYFTDKNNTSLVLSFSVSEIEQDKKAFVLTNLSNNKHSIYTQSNDDQKIYGCWELKPMDLGTTMYFKPNGKAVMTLFAWGVSLGSKYISYSYNEGTLSIDNSNCEEVIWVNDHQFKNQNQEGTFTRLREPITEKTIAWLTDSK